MTRRSSELKRFSHSIGQNWYHVVLIPRMRYPIFKQSHQRELALQAIDWICVRHNIDLFTKEVMEDHVHLFVSCPPDYSIRRMIQTIKGGTSFYIRSHHPALRKYKALWSKGYMYRSVGHVTAETVRKYIDESNKWVGGGQKTLI
ncbi:MAG TPA: IS200/IS605 family transposase [Candidatus Nanoarchaeia archaeon]|nr:IS200/IS605 family transposase [Candidatus Nanoarchaeia archaeon]